MVKSVIVLAFMAIETYGVIANNALLVIWGGINMIAALLMENTGGSK